MSSWQLLIGKQGNRAGREVATTARVPWSAEDRACRHAKARFGSSTTQVPIAPGTEIRPEKKEKSNNSNNSSNMQQSNDVQAPWACCAGSGASGAIGEAHTKESHLSCPIPGRMGRCLCVAFVHVCLFLFLVAGAFAADVQP